MANHDGCRLDCSCLGALLVSANTQRSARAEWQSAYPFENESYGLGVRVACTTSSGGTEVALTGTGNTLIVTNLGPGTAYLAWGDSSVVATTSYYPLFAGTKEPLTMPEGQSITHVAGMSDTTATLVIHKGYGN